MQHMEIVKTIWLGPVPSTTNEKLLELSDPENKESLPDIEAMLRAIEGNARHWFSDGPSLEWVEWVEKVAERLVFINVETPIFKVPLRIRLILRPYFDFDHLDDETRYDLSLEVDPACRDTVRTYYQITENRVQSRLLRPITAVVIGWDDDPLNMET